jgi:ABC-2 type transport system permease protein
VRKMLVIARRELASMFGGPLAWVLGAVFALLTGYFFYSDLTFYVLFGGANLSSGLWRYMFLDFRMVAMLVVPLVTMGLLAEERKLGTLELLWTFPVRDREVIAGKFLAALASYALMLLPTLIGPAVLYVMHPFALGPLAAGYAGMLLLGAAFIACGLAASALTDSQGVSALLTYGVLVLSWFLAWNEAALSDRIAPVVVALSLFDRFYGFAQGTIDSRDVAYFAAFITLFLFLALRVLGARSWRGVS